MTQRDFFIDIFGFILAVFVLRMLRFCITSIYLAVKDYLRENFRKHDTQIRDHFQKWDFVINKMRIFGIRWHFIAAFVYVAYMRLHSMHIL